MACSGRRRIAPAITRHAATCRLPKSGTSAPIRPPDLIIQDEFHLISGPLGTMVGLYEAAVDELCTWTVGGKTAKPKIVASTATVRKAREQVNNVFMRRVAVFPPSGLEVADNFFSVQRPVAQMPGRRYLGVCSPGSSRPGTAHSRLYGVSHRGAGPVRQVWPGGRSLPDDGRLLQFAARARGHEAAGGRRRADTLLSRPDEPGRPPRLGPKKREFRQGADLARLQSGYPKVPRPVGGQVQGRLRRRVREIRHAVGTKARPGPSMSCSPRTCFRSAST